jgi:hypothetical protein
MTDPFHSTPSAPSEVAQHPRTVGLVRLAAWLLISEAGIVLWLQYPGGPWEFGTPLLVGSGVILMPRGSWRQSVPSRTAFLSISVFLLLVLGAYFLGWSLPGRHRHPSLLLGFKIAGAVLWLAVAIRVSHLVVAGRQKSPAV